MHANEANPMAMTATTEKENAKIGGGGGDSGGNGGGRRMVGFVVHGIGGE